MPMSPSPHIPARVSIVVVAGIRPQFIKVAALQSGIQKWNENSSIQIDATYVNVQQHYDDELAGSIVRELGIHFDHVCTYQSYRFAGMLADMIVHVTDAIRRVAEGTSVDWVVVIGDANTTLAGAIAAMKLSYPLIHIEAGVRTGDMRSPEEVNRIVVDHLANCHFVSSKDDVYNLAREGIGDHVIWTGDILYDFVKHRAAKLPVGYGPYADDEYVLASIHRQENLDSAETMRNIMRALSNHPRHVLFVTHPRTRKRLLDLQISEFDNIRFLSALTHDQMISAIKGCAFVITDSGGLQREAYYLGKRALIRQDVPFWPCLTRAGAHKAIGVQLDQIQQGLSWIEGALKTLRYPSIADLGDGNAVTSVLQSIVSLNACCPNRSNENIERNCLS